MDVGDAELGRSSLQVLRGLGFVGTSQSTDVKGALGTRSSTDPAPLGARTDGTRHLVAPVVTRGPDLTVRTPLRVLHNGNQRL